MEASPDGLKPDEMILFEPPSASGSPAQGSTTASSPNTHRGLTASHGNSSSHQRESPAAATATTTVNSATSGRREQQQQQHHHMQQHQHHQQHMQSWGASSAIQHSHHSNPGHPGVECTDADIVISTGLEHSRTRPANLEYQRLLLANTILFHSLPSHHQSIHAQHLYHFLTHVRGRRFLQCVAPSVHVPFAHGHVQIAQEIMGDACKMAFMNRNPLWMLQGLQVLTTTDDAPVEQSWVHRVHPRGDEWEHVSLEQVKEILRQEGPVHLLILPPGIEIKSVVSDRDESAPEEDPHNQHHPSSSSFHHHHHHQDSPNAAGAEGHQDISQNHVGGGDEHGLSEGEDGILQAAEQAVAHDHDDHHHHDEDGLPHQHHHHHPDGDEGLPPHTLDNEDNDENNVDEQKSKRART